MLVFSRYGLFIDNLILHRDVEKKKSSAAQVSKDVCIREMSNCKTKVTLYYSNTLKSATYALRGSLNVSRAFLLNPFPLTDGNLCTSDTQYAALMV